MMLLLRKFGLPLFEQVSAGCCTHSRSICFIWRVVEIWLAVAKDFFEVCEEALYLGVYLKVRRAAQGLKAWLVHARCISLRHSGAL
jgi:hypothetical protein